MPENNFDKELVYCTFFVPCLNEENNIIRTINNIIKSVESCGIESYEILVNDDCSDDI